MESLADMRLTGGLHTQHTHTCIPILYIHMKTYKHTLHIQTKTVICGLIVMVNCSEQLGELWHQQREVSLGTQERNQPEKAEVERLAHCGRHHPLSQDLGLHTEEKASGAPAFKSLPPTIDWLLQVPAALTSWWWALPFSHEPKELLSPLICFLSECFIKTKGKNKTKLPIQNIIEKTELYKLTLTGQWILQKSLFPCSLFQRN